MVSKIRPFTLGMAGPVTRPQPDREPVAHYQAKG